MAGTDYGECGDDTDGDRQTPRPYIGIHFECCGTYARIYRQPDQRVYSGRCPRCLRTVMVRVGPDGTTARIFRAR